MFINTLTQKMTHINVKIIAENVKQKLQVNFEKTDR